MVMCSKCHKRMAVVFITKIEGGEKVSEGLCIKCAKELGLPVDNMLGNVLDKFGLTSDQIENMEAEVNDMLAENGGLPSDNDDGEDGGAPAIDFPTLIKESGLFNSESNVEGLPKNIEKKAASDKKEKKNSDANDEKKKYKFLPMYCRNLTDRARKGELDTIVGRDRELSRVIQILCRRQKNNPCLIGEPGVGKTAIAEALAQKIASGNVPYALKNKEIYLVDLTALVAGTQFRGQFESRILGLLNEVKDAGNVILVIDEVHNIVGAGDSEGSISAANILKPALSRGEVQVIGATTLKEYRKYIEKDSALERRFQPVTVNEPSIKDTVEMLRGIKHYYEEFHSIIIPEEVLFDAVLMSERYITERYLPDKAIDLLDEAASSLSLNSAELNETREIRDELLKLKKTREELLDSAQTDDEKQRERNYEALAKVKSKEMKLSDRLHKLEPICSAIMMTRENLADVIEVWTGVPASSINENEYEKIDNLYDNIKERIIGQDKAVEAVVRAIKRSRAGISYKRKPVSFIFAGPTGVGKTELVKVLANLLFDSPETLIRLDMSEFMEKHSVSKIIGAPPGYVGYDEAGQLTEKIRRKPYSVILFDEIEKAHPDVLNVMLQILDDGRVTDAQGRVVNFENTVIVMTTNAGSNRSGALGFASNEHSLAQNATEKALSEFLRPEFLNRVDEVITFNSLTADDFTHIVKIMLSELRDALAFKGMSLKYTDAAAKLIAERSYSHKYGARNMRRYIQKNIEDKLAELIISDYKHSYTEAGINVKDGEIAVSCS